MSSQKARSPRQSALARLANATDHHGISLVQRFGALAQSKMLRLLIQHGADVLDLVQVGFSSGMVKKPVEAHGEVLQLLHDAPSVRARFLEEQRVKEQAERSQQEAEARRKAQEEEERRRRKCPQGYDWVREGSHWRCQGGSHVVPDAALNE